MWFGERSCSFDRRFGQSRHQVSDRATTQRREPGKEQEMSSIRSIIRHVASAALLASAAVAGPAQAVSIDVGSYTKSGLAAEFATSYDTFTIIGDKFNIAMPQTPVEISLGTFWFEVGPN